MTGDFYSDHYAMHFAVTGRLATTEEVANLNAILPPGGQAFADGDNAMEWGEAYNPALYDSYENLTERERRDSHAGHLVIYLPKGTSPNGIWDLIKNHMPALNDIEDKWSFQGLPFSVDEASCWGDNVGKAHLIGVTG